MENEKLFELMTKMYGEMQAGFKRVDNEIKDVKNGIKDVKAGVIKIENDHGKKLDMLFDGYKQNTEQLHRIEKQVSKHDEFILKRVK